MEDIIENEIMENEIMQEPEFFIGQIFQESYPPQSAIWCNEQGNCFIEEIEPTEDGVKQYQIKEVPPLTPEEEKARIQELYMTRSDFFDGTIRAFGLDGDDLLTIITAYFAQNDDYDPLQEKIAISNFKNALNFYRKYPLFQMLSGVNIPISETETINITSEQWDRFFDETNKRNPEAYKELLPIVEEPTEEPSEVE